MVFCHLMLTLSLTLTLTLTLTLPITLTNPNPNPTAKPINVCNIPKNDRHNQRQNAPPVKWDVEIRLLFLPVFVAHGLKVRLPVFVAISYTKSPYKYQCRPMHSKSNKYIHNYLSGNTH